MSNEKNKLVCLADSVGTNYKLKVRTNTFSELLARRLGLEVHNYALPGATTGYQLGFLQNNEEMIDAVKDSKVVVIACGTNNVLVTGLVIMEEAAGIDTNSWRGLPKTVETLKTNPILALKMVTALNSKEAKEKIMVGVDAFKNDMPKLINRIRELNDEAIIVVVTIYTMSDISRSPIYKITTKSQSEIADNINNWSRQELPKMDVLVADLQNELKNYNGKEELSNLNEDDIHLSDAGHLFTYRLIYDTIIEKYPDLACEECENVIQIRKRKEKINEDKKTDDPHAVVEDIIRSCLNREDLEYSEDKMLSEMNISLMEVLDISRTLEKRCYGGKEVLVMPRYNLQMYITPKYYIDVLNGESKESASLHTAELPHYKTEEEKIKDISNDSPAMKVFREKVYKYLKDDMIILDKDATLFGDLKMNYIDWGDVVYETETDLNIVFDIARKKGYENLTVRDYVDYADRDLKNNK
ncbi:MAG: SGNH/GDSL hydrolase family protein [Erysipelotrichaceae bacterium]|nr:SGNH/GDSL hydrolase family protein [Erysipelotrichaceae bacterium]